MKSKIVRDTGGGCSICGQGMMPPENIEGTYWLCAECLHEKYSSLLSVLRQCVELVAEAGPMAWVANDYFAGAKAWEAKAIAVISAARPYLERKEGEG